MGRQLYQSIAYKALQNFFDKKPFVLFGSGTSCAVHRNFGMGKLEEYLLQEIPRESLTSSQLQEWETLVTSLQQGSDLESSMNVIRDENLRLKIIDHTATLVGALDKEFSPKILSGETNWPATSLLNRMVDTMSGEDCILHVATTNYDLLIEYALESMNIPYLTGFHGGVYRQLNWEEAERSVIQLDRVSRKSRMSLTKKYKKHVRLYKVHGSLNTFKLKDRILQNNVWMYGGIPGAYERVMITPGTSKYEALHQKRYDLLGEYDRAIEKHDAFLFIGFGFNDNQLINDSIKRKLKEQGCPGLILTRGSNSRIQSYVKECKNLWLLCRYEENGRVGTRISNSSYETPLDLEGKNLWDASEFTREILGG